MINVKYIENKIALCNTEAEILYIQQYVKQLKQIGLLDQPDFKTLSEKICGQQYFNLRGDFNGR